MSKKKNIKYPIVWTSNGEEFVYVDKLTPELRPEYRRLADSIRLGIRMLSFMRRIRHPAIVSARFNLLNAGVVDPDSLSDEQVALELGRLSHLMHDTVTLLNQLSGSRIDHLEQARFQLTFGQVPKKRDLHGPSKQKERYETIDDNEWQADSDDER